MDQKEDHIDQKAGDTEIPAEVDQFLDNSPDLVQKYHDIVQSEKQQLPINTPIPFSTPDPNLNPETFKENTVQYLDTHRNQPIIVTRPLENVPAPFADGGSIGMADVDSFLGDQSVLPLDVPSPAQSSPSTASSVPPEVDQFLAPELKYSTATQQAITAAEALGRGLVGPLAPLAETAAGIAPEDILGRQEVNPSIASAGEAAGLIGPAIASLGSTILAKAGLKGAAAAVPLIAKGAGYTQAGLVGKVGENAAKALGLGVQDAGLASQIAASATKGATELALLQAGNETSRMIENDPNQSLQTAIANIGLSGLFGLGTGVALGTVSPLWKATSGTKVNQLISDFKGRINDHLTNPDPVATMTKELQDYYGNTKSIADEVYGPTGLKAQDIAKSVPELNEAIANQAQEVGSTVEDAVNKMIKNPESYPPRLTQKLQSDLQQYIERVTVPGVTSNDTFNAIQDLKQTLQSYSKFDKFVKPVDEAYDFVKDAKQLQYKLRENLEDSDVWGKAADRQKAINNAFTQYLPTLKDFEKKFTTQVSGEPTIDPGKVSTYLNQLGKPNAEIKQTMLDNFLKATEKYRQVIADSHSNLGLDSPIIPSSLAVTAKTLNKVTPGMKLADIFIKKGLTEAGGRTIGAGVGAVAGGAVGHAGIGALAGEHALGPFFSSVLPAIMKPILNSAENAEGLKASMDYGIAVAKGEQLASKAIKNVFKSSDVAVLPKKVLPTEGDRLKLNEMVQESKVNPSIITSVGGILNHYLPDHNVVMGHLAANSVKYLSSVNPDTPKQGPLDNNMPISTDKKDDYNRILDVAQQPLIVLNKIKDGTITPRELVTVKTLYPDLYSNLSQKLISEIVTQTNKGSTIPYKTRIGLSLFLAQPLDGTMTPNAILSAQPSSQTGNMLPSMAPKQQSKRSISALNKLPQSYETPGQAAINRKLLHK